MNPRFHITDREWDLHRIFQLTYSIPNKHTNAFIGKWLIYFTIYFHPVDMVRATVYTVFLALELQIYLEDLVYTKEVMKVFPTGPESGILAAMMTF